MADQFLILISSSVSCYGIVATLSMGHTSGCPLRMKILADHHQIGTTEHYNFVIIKSAMFILDF